MIRVPTSNSICACSKSVNWIWSNCACSLVFNLGRWKKKYRTCYFQRGQWSALLSFARGGRCFVLYKRQCYDTLWHAASSSFRVARGHIIVGWTCPFVAGYYKFIFFCGGRFSNLIITSRIVSKEWIIVKKIQPLDHCLFYNLDIHTQFLAKM